MSDLTITLIILLIFIMLGFLTWVIQGHEDRLRDLEREAQSE